MPDLAGLFSHVLVDVSSVKALCFRWFPRGKKMLMVLEQNDKHAVLNSLFHIKNKKHIISLHLFLCNCKPRPVFLFKLETLYVNCD